MAQGQVMIVQSHDVVRAFHPHAEAQVACDTPGHVAAEPVRVLAADLEWLLAPLCGPDDLLLVRREPTADHLDRLREVGLPVPASLVAPIDRFVLPRRHALRERLDLRPRPWGWTPDTCAFFAPFSRRHPVPKWGSDRRLVWSKVTAARVLADLDPRAFPTETSGLWRPDDVPIVATSTAAIGRALEAARDDVQQVVIKAPFGTAGRGAKRFPTGGPAMTRSDQRWIDRVLRAQGAVVIAPWRQRIADVSVQLDVGSPHPVLGVTGLLCDPLGRYRGNLVNPPRDEFGLERSLLALAAVIAKRLATLGFVGPAGVDAMVYADPQTGHPRLQPLLEINPRLTMGHVALALRRHVAASSAAALIVLGPRDRLTCPLPSVIARLQTVLPLRQVASVGLEQAVIPLNDPATATAHLAVLIVAATPAEIRAATDEITAAQLP